MNDSRLVLKLTIGMCLAVVLPGPSSLWAAMQKESFPAAVTTQNAETMPMTFTEPSEYFERIYSDFYNNYRLGRGDEIAIRLVGEPDYSIERTKISSIGRIYHPLVGDIGVVGLTVDELTHKLTSDFSEYIVNPRVSVQLLEAQGAKIGVLGEVYKPGILMMTEPMTILNAIVSAGGVSGYGSKSAVTLLRQNNDGSLRTVSVNLKRILQGKADPDENLTLRAGDTVVVHGNLRKKIADITNLGIVSQFLAFLTYSRW
jgi:polysaccharide export outer membrane protein